MATVAEAFATQDNDCKALQDLGRAPKSDAEKSLQKTLRKWDLTLPVPWKYVNLSADCSVPMLMPSDYIATLAEKGYLHKLLGGSVASSAMSQKKPLEYPSDCQHSIETS